MREKKEFQEKKQDEANLNIKSKIPNISDGYPIISHDFGMRRSAMKRRTKETIELTCSETPSWCLAPLFHPCPAFRLLLINKISQKLQLFSLQNTYEVSRDQAKCEK